MANSAVIRTEPRPTIGQNLAVAALGVVYGDIGTSPLYTVKQCFENAEVTQMRVFGVLSLIAWSLTLVVTLKYVLVLMKADNRGEGGILALMVLVVLFLVQRRGTSRVGAYFGPIMILWFTAIALLGAAEIARRPSILLGVAPHYAIDLLMHHPWHGFVLLGSVVLAVTGAEALYADMGHFGRSPIRRAWLRFVFPSLLLNYFGQGALLLAKPHAIENPFYLLAPGWALYPLVVLASTATVIASQAVISGAFSITRQAVQLGYLPRMAIRHTSEQEIGQVYVPAMNGMLLVAVVATVLIFRSSDALGGAYGIAVTGTMSVTTVLAFVYFRRGPGWPLWRLVPLFGLFLFVDLSFFGANLLKIIEGGWFPL